MSPVSSLPYTGHLLKVKADWLKDVADEKLNFYQPFDTSNGIHITDRSKSINSVLGHEQGERSVRLLMQTTTDVKSVANRSA